MKTNKLAYIILIVCTSTLLLAGCGNTSNTATGTTSGNAVIDNILNRKSVRQYTDRPVEEEKISLMLRAGLAAPSARDLRPQELVVIRDRATLDSMAAELSNAKMLSQAQLAIIVCGDTTVNPRFWMIDGSATAENILLAAESLGLGAVWTAAYPYAERIDVARRFANLPDHIQPLCIIPVGYPKGPQAPKDKFTEKKIHYEKF